MLSPDESRTLAILRHAAGFAGGVCAVVGSVGQAGAFGSGVTSRASTATDVAWAGVLVSLGAALVGTIGSVLFSSRVLSALLLFTAAIASFVGAAWFVTDTLPALANVGAYERAGGLITASWLMVLACPLLMLGGALRLHRRRAG